MTKKEFAAALDIEGGAEGIWIYAGKNGGGAWDFQKDPCGD